MLSLTEIVKKEVLQKMLTVKPGGDAPASEGKMIGMTEKARLRKNLRIFVK